MSKGQYLSSNYWRRAVKIILRKMWGNPQEEGGTCGQEHGR